MSSAPTRDSPEKPDARPSFRKPSNDGARRKYRHRSPVDGSDSSSSSSGVSPKHEQNIIHVNSLENRGKVSDDRARKSHDKESEKGPDRIHSSKVDNSHRYPDNYRSSRDYQHSDEGGGYHRLSDDEDKNSVRYSGRELGGGRSDHGNHHSSFERSKENRNADRYHSTNKPENSWHRSRGKGREGIADHRYSEKEPFRVTAGGLQTTKRDYKRPDEWDRHRERNDRDDRRMHYRSPNDYRKEIAPSSEDCRRHAKDTFIGRESEGRENASYRQKESQRKDIDEHDYQAHKRRYNDKDSRNYLDKYSLDTDGNRKKESDYKTESYADKNSNTTEVLSSSSKKLKTGQFDKVPLGISEEKASSSKQVKEVTEKFNLAPPGSAVNLTEFSQDLNAAKNAAIQAAELVNRNLVGTGIMSSDQKKKLLWGNKKNASEESGTRWDLQLFDDRERQEKFNKLMGVKGDTVLPERKPDEKDVEKQKELQIDLERQYTAGLRRRDGRTVGLGL